MSNAVLVQEWIEGVEYAVDTVSRDGEHKVTAMWRYDKRPVNGGPFVYFCTELEGFRVFNYVSFGIGLCMYPLSSFYISVKRLQRWNSGLKN